MNSQYIELSKIAADEYNIDISKERFTIRELANGIQYEINNQHCLDVRRLRGKSASRRVIDNLKTDPYYYEMMNMTQGVQVLRNKLKLQIVVIMVLIFMVIYMFNKRRKLKDKKKKKTSRKQQQESLVIEDDSYDNTTDEDSDDDDDSSDE